MSQIPDSFSYQAIIRDSDNTLLKNQTVKVEASILRGEEVIFTQIIEGKTNENGLLSLSIGGTPEFGDIDWTDGQLYIQTRIDPMGGSDFAIETTAQLMSVPYSMAAQMAMNVPGLDLLKERINKLEEQVQELKDIIIPCNCIMDTLRGEWSWEKTLAHWWGYIDNDFKSILKILNQNEDGSINYEVFVEDTLYYKDSFQYQYIPFNEYAIIITNLELPHHDYLPFLGWTIFFIDINMEPNKNILRFWMPGFEAPNYFYFKIKK